MKNNTAQSTNHGKLVVVILFAILGIYTTLTSTRVYEVQAGASNPRDTHQATACVDCAVLFREVTAYTLGNPAETDDTPCIGASNKNLCDLAKQGIQVCASNEFEFGTRLLVGEIECVVEDRMASRYSDRVDLAFMDRDEALKFGRQELSVKILYE